MKTMAVINFMHYSEPPLMKAEWSKQSLDLSLRVKEPCQDLGIFSRNPDESFVCTRVFHIFSLCFLPFLLYSLFFFFFAAVEGDPQELYN
jgi:hypothetical protein